ANAQAAIDSLIADFNDHPALSHALFSIAEKYFYKGNYRQAIDLWQLVRTDYPDCPLNHEIPYLLATCYERLEEYPTAIEYYIEVVEQYPDSRYAYRAPYRLGVLYRRQKHYDKALYWFQKQRELYSDKLHAERALHCQGAIYLRNLEDYQAAAEICQKLLEEYPEGQYTTITKYNLAVCYDILAPSAETRKMLQEARDKLYSDVITIKPIEKPSKSQEGG
ncbi:MAG: tetratricopeptide repeat protein, partial [Desulfobacteraceae bacterium]|nr:tetratricopeptide repeat protein [Desulfobacteraceae bacterium]